MGKHNRSFLASPVPQRIDFVNRYVFRQVKAKGMQKAKVKVKDNCSIQQRAKDTMQRAITDDQGKEDTM